MEVGAVSSITEADVQRGLGHEADFSYHLMSAKGSLFMDYKFMWNFDY